MKSRAPLGAAGAPFGDLGTPLGAPWAPLGAPGVPLGLPGRTSDENHSYSIGFGVALGSHFLNIVNFSSTHENLERVFGSVRFLFSHVWIDSSVIFAVLEFHM